MGRWSVVMLAIAAGPAMAQSPVYRDARAALELESRAFTFDDGIALRRASQLAWLMSAGRPFGNRLFLDVTTSYASTGLEAHDGARLDLSGFTDTQVRGSYTLGDDAVVLSLGVNLPSGVSKIASDELAVVRSASQNFLPFPVTNYGTGFGGAAGAVLVKRFGEWDVGLATSLRYTGSYQPFSDTAGSYTPGAEGRVRLGFQRLLGERTSVSGGFTYTTFGTDEFTGVPSFVYRSGNRYIGEVALTQQFGRSVLRVVGWAYVRAAGDSSGATVNRAGERILHGGVLLERPRSRRFSIDAGLEGRTWKANGPGQGWVLGVRGGARYRLSETLTAAFSGRLETGRITLDIGEAGLGGLGLTLALVASR